ncbi:hypothetical protein [Spirosoma koreense]
MSPSIDPFILNQFKAISLFTECGKPFKGETPPFNFEQITDVETVNKNLISSNWENFMLEGKNVLNYYLQNFFRNKEQEKEALRWNQIVDHYKEQLSDLENFTKGYLEASGLNKIMLHDINWIVLNMCMENHYRKLDPKIPILFLNMLPIYTAGHIPCGWQGDVKRKTDRKAMNISEGVLFIY